MNGYYQISNLGRVRSLDRKVNWYSGRTRIIKGKILKFGLDGNGYCKIELMKENKKERKKIHRLVAEAFLNKEDFKYMFYENKNLIEKSKLEVNHKDENPLNNRVDNLEWCTHTYNNCYGTKIQRTNLKLNKAVLQYDINNNFIREWESCATASRTLKINWSNLVGVCNGKRKTAGNYVWKYKEVSQC